MTSERGQPGPWSGNSRSRGAGSGGGRTGEVLGGIYRLVRRIGKGGMGEVYEAEHLNLQRRCAVKILTGAAVENSQVLERFLREARIAARLNSEHVVRTFDFGRDADGVPYAVMELLQGENLAQRLERAGVLAPAQWAPLLRQIASAIDLAHAEGVVHRDLKPENIFLHDPDGFGPPVTRPALEPPSARPPAATEESTDPGSNRPFGPEGASGPESTDPLLIQPFGPEGASGPESTDPLLRQPFGPEGASGPESTDPLLRQPFGAREDTDSEATDPGRIFELGERTRPGLAGPDVSETTLEDVEQVMEEEAASSAARHPLGLDDDPAATKPLAGVRIKPRAAESGASGPALPVDPVVKILDFGISKLRDALSAITKDRECLGTPQYMSPEQAGQGAGEVTHHTDIFALGTITYEMLSGRLPFTAPTPMGVLYKICNEPPVPLRQVMPVLSPFVCSVVERALAKRPEDRFQSAEQMACRFEDAVRGIGAVDGMVETSVPAAPGPVAVRRATVEKRTAVSSGARSLLVGAALMVGLVALFVVSFRLLRRSDSAGERTAGGRNAMAASSGPAGGPARDAQVDASQEVVLLTLTNLPPGAFPEVTVNGALHEERPVRLPKGKPCRIRVALPAHDPDVFDVTPVSDVTYRVNLALKPGLRVWAESESPAGRTVPVGTSTGRPGTNAAVRRVAARVRPARPVRPAGARPGGGPRPEQHASRARPAPRPGTTPRKTGPDKPAVRQPAPARPVKPPSAPRKPAPAPRKPRPAPRKPSGAMSPGS